MTKRQALTILGVGEDISQEDLRKKYRELMILTHPDMVVEHDYPYDAAEINAAYEYLLSFQKIGKSDCNREPAVELWNAPINENAYTDRDILGYAEDSTGVRQGNIHIATGKYVWIEDEDFSLFLLSIYSCSMKIIDEAEISRGVFLTESRKEKLQAEVVYLLAGQFVNPYMVLSKYHEKEMYSIPAMLEYTGGGSCSPNDLLYPKAINNHKLYVANRNREEMGYISFKDDRLYYCLIPLFEERKVMIKMKVRSNISKRTGVKRYSDIELDLIFKDENTCSMVESINLKIEDQLNKALGDFEE